MDGIPVHIVKDDGTTVSFEEWVNDPATTAKVLARLAELENGDPPRFTFKCGGPIGPEGI